MPLVDPALRRERLKGFARDLRANATEAERKLWGLLRDRRLMDFKFRRQQAIGPFIVDFVCYDARLVIELDGSQHADDHVYDAARDEELRRRGLRVIRVWNGDMMRNRNGVLETILAELQRGEVRVAPPSSALRAPSPIEGEGDGTESARTRGEPS